MQFIWITLSQILFSLMMYAISALFFGAAMVPSLAVFFKVLSATQDSVYIWKLFSLGFALALGYILFGLTLILLVGLFRTVFRLRLKEGEYPMFSLHGIQWAFLGSLYLMIQYTFMDFVLLTPFANLLFRLLGMKLGKNVQFNSKFVFDATLLEIGDGTVVGGGVIINGHTVERGKLVLKKVRIGKKVTLGSHCTVMPGCMIEDKAIIAANAMLMKGSHVGEKEVWGGLPAELIKK